MDKDEIHRRSLQSSFGLVIFLIFIVLTVSVSAILYTSVEKNIVNQFEEKEREKKRMQVPIKPIFLLADSQLLFWKENENLFLKTIREHIDNENPKAAYIGASNGDNPISTNSISSS